MCVHRESGAQRAVKVLRKSHMDDDEKRMLFNEINILKEIVSGTLFFCNTLLGILGSFFALIDRVLCNFANSVSCERRITPTSSRCTSSLRTRSATTLSLSKCSMFRLHLMTEVLFLLFSRICKGGELFDEIL